MVWTNTHIKTIFSSDFNIVMNGVEHIIILGDDNDELRSILSPWTLHFCTFQETPEQILQKSGLSSLDSALILMILPPKEEEFWLKWIEQSSATAMLIINSYPVDSKSAADELFTFAQHGFIPSNHFFKKIKDEEQNLLVTGILYNKKPYSLRHPILNDLSPLIELEEISWPGFGVSSEVIKERITQQTTNQIILEVNNSVGGVIYSQPIKNAADVMAQTGATVHQLYDPNGLIIQLIAVNIFPYVQTQGLGIDLLEFMLKWRSLQPNIEEVVAVTRWGHYQHHQELSPEEYLKLTNEQGDILDPIVHMHESHGASIKTLIPHYRPNDVVNQGYGVLVHYNLGTRSIKKQISKNQFKNEPIDAEWIINKVSNAILTLLPKESQRLFTMDAPLMGLGIESLELMELRDSLSTIFEQNLHPTFLFLYGTGQAIVDYFIEQKLDQYRDWLYNVEWVELPIPLIPNTSGSGIWVIYCDETGYSDLLIAKLNSYGFTCIQVNVGAYFQQPKANQFKIRPDSLPDQQQLFGLDLFQSGIAGVIYLWGLFTELPDEPTLSLLQSLHTHSCIGLLNMVQALTRMGSPTLPRLFVTSWSIGEEGSSMAIAQWPMTGLSKAIAAEHPEFKLRQISFDSKVGHHHTIDNLFLELFAKDKEEQVLWRGGKRLGPRVIRIELPEAKNPEFDSTKTYLITGGLGGLGLGFAQWYVAHGVRHLVLIDANELTMKGQELINELKAQQINVTVYAQIDIGNKALMGEVFAEIKKDLPPLKGVMHLASMIDDDLLMNLTWERFTPIFNLSVAGSWNLHLLTKNESLDHFILFSSIGSVMGPLWRANRSAANAFLDALAHYRKAMGLPSLTLNWGPWGYDDMLVKNSIEINIPEGLSALSIDEGVKVLDRVFNIAQPQIVIAPINWPQLLGRFSTEKPLFTNLAREVGLRKSEIISHFREAREEERSSIVQNYIQVIVRRVLFLSPTSKIDENLEFSSMGIDARALLEIKNQMQFDLGDDIELPFNIIVDNPSVACLDKALQPIFERYLFENAVSDKSVLESGTVEPIAIIGMSCRFPGGANSPNDYWTILHQGIDSISEVPANRWDIDAYYNSDKEVPGKMYTRYGGFIDNVDLFDPQFFGISPREAEDMDPQQRISLEVTWEAIENAGIAANTLKGSKTGVFMGICFNDYGQLIRQSGDVSAVDNYYSTGNHYSVSAGRISYILGLEGPAMAIDTACSSSLVSIDNAVKHLRLKECDLAIAGGVNLILAPESTINFCKSGMLAVDGRCKTFDAAADGYVRSEGCGILILKRLSDAQRDKDHILAVIHATAINQDGASTGLTVPNQKAQENVIKAALKQAQLKNNDIDYVEAHGTGTSLGDPIEVKAIASTYGEQRSAEQPLILGSAKTNIGHTEAAAGVAGLMKCVLALEHEEIPQHLHYNTLNPYIDINPELIQIAATAKEWKAGGKPRYAAISSFGFSGTNSHAIIGDAPSTELSDEQRPPYILPLSAKTPEALAEQWLRIKAFIENDPELNLSDVAYTLQLGREHFSYRQVIVGQSREELLANTFEEPDKFLQNNSNSLTSQQSEMISRWLAGETIDWTILHTEQKRNKIILPTYPFQRERYWAQTAIKSQERNTSAYASLHPIINDIHYMPRGQLHLTGAIDLTSQKMYLDHQVFNQIIFPGTGFIELMCTAAQTYFSSYRLENVSIEKPLLLNEQHVTLVSVLLSPEGDSYQVQLDSLQSTQDIKSTSWMHHCSAKLSQSVDETKSIVHEHWLSLCPQPLAMECLDGVRQVGLQYGPEFKGLSSLYVGEQNILGHIEVNEQELRYHLHPALMDCSVQLLQLLLQSQNTNHASSGVYLPVAFESIRVYQTGFTRAWGYLHLRELTNQHLATADITLCDDQGRVLVEIIGYQAKRIEEQAFVDTLDSLYAHEDIFYDLRWQDDARANSPLTPQDKQILIYGNEQSRVKSELEAQGFVCNLLNNIDSLNIYTQSTDIVFLGQRSNLNSTQDLLNLVKSINTVFTQRMPCLWIVTELAQSLNNDVDPWQLPVIGLGRTLMNEHPELRTRLIDIEPQETSDLADALSNNNDENQIAYRNHRRMVARLHSDALEAQKLPEHYHLNINPKGLLSNLRIKSKTPSSPKANEVQIEVHATGLNFRDVLNAMDLYPGDPGPLGLECSGVIIQIGEDVNQFAVGDEVMALSWDSFSDLVTVHVDLVTLKPKHISFEDAASIPLVFQTAYYSLITLGHLKQGDKVLIHAASGGIGDAAIQIAQHVGAEIYATASPGKWNFIKAKGITHLYNSRTLDFADQIMKDTQDKGIDVVINALNGEFIEQTVRCIKPGGTFIEIGKRDIWSQERMQKARPDIQYHIVAIDALMTHEPGRIHDLWTSLTPLFAEKRLAPLTTTIFSITDALSAFEYMQASKHIGKVVIKAQTTQKSENLFKADATYLITAGLGALGLQLAKWLVSQGVKHLVLTTRKDPNTDQQLQLNQLHLQGAQIHLHKADMCYEMEVSSLMQWISNSLPPLKGLFHTAGVVDDGIIDQLSWARFQTVLAPKVDGSWFLHQNTKNLNLDYFVLFSSVVSVFGLAGQANYAAANAFMDGLCAHRRHHGLPGISINWGPWSEVGMAVRQKMNIPGMRYISIKQGFNALSRALNCSQNQLVIASMNWDEYLNTSMGESPLFREVNKKTARKQTNSVRISLKDQLVIIDEDERETALSDYLSKQVRIVLNLKENQLLESHRGFFDVGMDSLMAVELKNKLQQDLGLEKQLIPTLIFSYPSVNALKDYYRNELLADLWNTADHKSDIEQMTQEQADDIAIEKEGKELSIEEIMRELNQG